MLQTFLSLALRECEIQCGLHLQRDVHSATTFIPSTGDDIPRPTRPHLATCMSSVTSSIALLGVHNTYVYNPFESSRRGSKIQRHFIGKSKGESFALNHLLASFES